MSLKDFWNQFLNFYKKNLRFFWVILIFVIVALTIITCLNIKIFEAPPNPTFKEGKINERGSIYDRNGNPMALQEQIFHLTVNRNRLNKEHLWKISERLAPLLNLTTQQIHDHLSLKTPNRTYLRKNITPEQAKLIKGFRESDPVVFDGIEIEEKLVRCYPLHKEASHLLGFVNIEDEGKGGLEYTLDPFLAPFDHTFDYTAPADAYLTIDQNIQHYTEVVAQKAYDNYDAEYSLFIVLDAKNAEILAMTCRPNYDPNDLSTTNNQDLINKVVSTAFEPGSVFKIFSIGIALNLGVIDEDTFYYCDGGYNIEVPHKAPIRIHCFNKNAHYSENFASIIKNSCNAGTAFAVESIDNKCFYNEIKKFGFIQKVNIGLPNEAIGSLKEPDEWSLRSKPTIAMGQEISTTALQIVQAATVYTNDGTLLKPHIIKKLQRKDKNILYEAQRTPLREVLSPKTAKLILSAMEINTLAGTGKRAHIDGIKISTKTGTSQIYDPEAKRYSDDAFLASTLAIFPTEDPQIIIYGALNYPKQGRPTGASLVAPLIRELAEDCISYYNMTKETDTTILTNKMIASPQVFHQNLGETMPDLIGKSKRDILFLYQLSDKTVHVNGNGIVVSQTPEAGTPFSEFDTIELKLE